MSIISGEMINVDLSRHFGDLQALSHNILVDCKTRFGRSTRVTFENRVNNKYTQKKNGKRIKRYFTAESTSSRKHSRNEQLSSFSVRNLIQLGSVLFVYLHSSFVLEDRWDQRAGCSLISNIKYLLFIQYVWAHSARPGLLGESEWVDSFRFIFFRWRLHFMHI